MTTPLATGSGCSVPSRAAGREMRETVKAMPMAARAAVIEISPVLQVLPGFHLAKPQGGGQAWHVKLSSPEARAESTQLSRALLLLLVAFVAACVLRFTDRAIKIMHTDEATQAVKLHEMMEGRYKYDPVDHHGPTLLYSRRVLNGLSGTGWKEMTESKLRITPALYGVALLLLLALVYDGMAKMALAWAAVFIAVSPLMVFYSRYFIMEVLLAFFTFGCIGCGWRYVMSRKPGWLAWAGVCAGLMHATKETCVLHFIGMGAGLLVAYGADFWSAGAGLGVVNRTRRQPVKRRHFLVFLACAAAASVTVFSQFFTEWRGVWDSVATYWNMLGRAGGQGHEKPFGYYFSLLWGGTMSGRPADLGFSPQNWLWALGLDADARRMVLTEGVLMALAGIGTLTAFTAKAERNQTNHFIRFLAVYAVATFLIYSLIGYKTPWCIMGAWHGLLLMAGLGAETLVRLFWNVWVQRVVMVVLGMAALHLAVQAWRTSRDFARESRNPYNYSMTSPDALAWVEKFHRFAELHPDGYGLRIDQSDHQGGWPLPWYLSRQFTNYDWQGGRPMDPGNAAVLLLSHTADEALRLQLRNTGQAEAFDDQFVAQSLTLHPSGSLQVYVRKDLWQQYLDRQPWEPLAVQQ